MTMLLIYAKQHNHDPHSVAEGAPAGLGCKRCVALLEV